MPSQPAPQNSPSLIPLPTKVGTVGCPSLNGQGVASIGWLTMT